jgi:hypothetical protein
MKTKLNLGLSIALLVACGGSLAQEGPPNVASTIGRGSVASTIGRGSVANPLSFCTLNELTPLVTSTNNLAGQKPVLWAWSVDAPPLALSKVLAISNASHPGCQSVQSLPIGGVNAANLRTPYAVIDKATDWSIGFTSIVIAGKKPDLPAGDFLPRLKRHVNLVVQLFESKGLDGYFVYFDGDVEWAYLHWPDLKTATDAFATPDGATGPKDFFSFAAPIMPLTRVFPAP